ncbi:G-protein alpha subunit-domain-containing protein [Xylariaceae sp. AK1471]|nr:G-protein alpha subunit-domain-containing protein [Xylariaceae sp. AK1471]
MSLYLTAFYAKPKYTSYMLTKRHLVHIMDPVTILQVVGTVVSFGDAVLRCISKLSSLKAQYHDAPIIVTSMIGQLHMVKIAQDQLSCMNLPGFNHDPRYCHLATQIGNALESFSLIIMALEKHFDRYNGVDIGGMSAKSKLGFLQDERELTNLSVLLDRQVNALNLVLQALHCQRWSQQFDVITQKESYSILQMAKDCSSSLVGLDDIASFISEETTANISAKFEFDSILRSTLLYQTAERSRLRQAIRPRRLIEEHNDISTLEISREAEKLMPEQASQDIITKEVNTSTTEVVLEMEKSSIIWSGSTGKSVQCDTAQSPASLGGWWRGSPRRKANVTANAFRPRQDRQVSKISSHTKILLLGICESGKTTLFNVLQQFVDPERFELDSGHFRTLVWKNAIESVRTVLRAMEILGIELELQRNAQYARTVLAEPCRNCYGDPTVNTLHTTGVAQAISSLWYDGGFQSAIRRKNEYSFHDNTEYFMTNIHKISRQATNLEVPSVKDILRTSVRTTQMYHTDLVYKNSKFYVYDVEGTRDFLGNSFRVVRNVATVMIPIDTTGYNRKLPEDKKTDRMLEQFLFFEATINDVLSTRTNFIVLFTKVDILENYLKINDARTFLAAAGVVSEKTPRITTVEQFLSHLEEHLRSQINSVDMQMRTRFISVNLVDIEEGNTADKIFSTLETLNELYPASSMLSPVQNDLKSVANQKFPEQEGRESESDELS